MFCVKCGTPLPDGANFCFKCGCDLRNLGERAGTGHSAVRVGDYVKFGSYPQNNGSNKESIEWLVLEVIGNEAFLVSRYGLDCKQYHHEYTLRTWENCDLREWLNHEFLKAAFSEEEQQRIKLSWVVNGNNRDYRTIGGSNTRDRVFCLSLVEAERYFKNDSERRCQPTSHARNQGAWIDDGNGYCYWWLRSPGSCQDWASGVGTLGVIDPRGDGVHISDLVVRPALRITL